jgi:hypothetical protein
MEDQKIDLEYVESTVNLELSDAESWMESDLAGEAEKNIDYYNGEPFGNESDGFSQVVTRDVFETVEGIMPELMKIFTSGDNVVEFDPVGPGDEQRVFLEGRYIDHVFMNRFEGYKLLYNWFKDALMVKNGYIKTGWEAKEEVQFRHFEGIEEEELDALKDGFTGADDLDGVEWELDSWEEVEFNDEVTFNARVKLTRMRGKPCIENIPFEEFKIKERSVDIKDAGFVAWTTTKTVGELLELGFDEDDIEDASPASKNESQVKDARFKSPSESTRGNEDVGSSDYDREVDYMEAWTRMYCHEEGRVKLIHSFHVGSTCLDFEETDRCPIISLVPMMTPHRHVGMCPADLVRDIQEIRSVIMRQMLDNLALQNAGRYTAVEGQVNYQDLIDNKIGGVIRQKMPGAVQRLDTPDLSQFTIPVLEGLEMQKENRTGVSRMTHGLDSNALNSHQTAGAVNAVMSAAQAKILLIARNFAETGVKELFIELYNLIREYQTTPDLIPVQGRFAVINPAEWIDRHDVHVTVGIGNGNKDQQLMHLNNINQMMGMIKQSEQGYMVTDQNVYNLASETIKNSGYDDPNKFITNPELLEKPEPGPSPEMIAAQAQMTRSQTEQAKEKYRQEKEFPWQQKTDVAELGMEAQQERPVGIGDGK